MLRVLAAAAALLAVLLLGHALYVFVQYGWPATLSVVLGLASAAAAVVLHRRGRS